MRQRIRNILVALHLIVTMAVLLPLCAFADVTNFPTTVTGGIGSVADIQANDAASYSVAKGASATINGFSAFGGAITSVYLFIEYAVDDGYTGTNAIKVNGVDTPFLPVDGVRVRQGFLDLTGGSYGVDTSGEITSLSVTFSNNDVGGGDSVHFDYVYLVINPELPLHMAPTWSDEFNGTGPADPAIWTYEIGYQRNNEWQYYTANNGWQEGGNFVIEGREETVDTYDYTSSSIRSVDKYSWKYGRAQIRAKLPCFNGMWPAIWMIGDDGEWPSGGECDIMEWYSNKTLANCAKGTTTRWVAAWDSANMRMDYAEAVDPSWRTSWHVWTIQWDQDNVRLYCDNKFMNSTAQSWLVNPDGFEPFKQPHNIWLNLAIGGNAGGSTTGTTFPVRYYIDYWRVWEGATDNTAPTDIHISPDSVNEWLPAGTLVGDLSVTDPDPAEVIRYSLVAGTGDDDNASFEIPEFLSDRTDTLVLRTAAVLDYDDGPTRSIRVKATDIEGATFVKVFTINVIPEPVIVLFTNAVSVQEGSTNSFQVKLRMLPSNTVTVNVARVSGDTDLTISSGSQLFFTPANGTTWQQVTLAAAQDVDITNGAAVFACTDPGGVFSSATVTVSESDSDNAPPEVNAGTDQTVYMAGPVGIDPIPGADVFLNAGLDDGINSIWEDSLGTWNFTNDTGVTYITDAGSELSGITSAYAFPGWSTGGSGGCDGVSLSDVDVGASVQPITLELWFKPDQSLSYPSNGQVLWETGGGSGMGISYRDGWVEVAHDFDEGQISADVSALTNEFVQVVVTYDTDSTNNNFKLYINGALAVTDSRTDSTMSGPDGAGLGNRAGNNAGGAGNGDSNTASFKGMIAIFRVYFGQLLDADGVASNYNSVVGSNVDADLDATVSDLDSQDLAIMWSVVSAPWAARIADPNAVDTTVTLYGVGEYVLRLTAADDVSSTSDTVTITVTANMVTGPMPPTNLTATATATNQIYLSWSDASTNETGFAIERSGTSGTNFTAVGTAAMDAADYTDNSVIPGITYYYRVIATNAVESGAPSAEAWATVPKMPALVMLDNLAHTYDGNSCTATVITVPAGLVCDLTYNGGTALPTNVGSYSVVATINEVSYQGTTNGTLVVSQGTPNVSVWPIATSIEDGQALSSSALIGGSASVGGSFAFENPSQTPSIGTNPVSVVFSPADSANYNSVTGTVDVIVTAELIPATVILDDLIQTYDGSAVMATVSTIPAGLAVTVTYNGSLVSPTNVGNYAVTGTVVEAGYKGTTNGTLVVSKATPTVDPWPTASAIVVGQAVSSATLSGGSPSVQGTFSYDIPTATPGVGTNAMDVIFTPTDGANYNSITGIVDVTVLPLPPSAPTGLSAVGSPSQVDLAWQASAGATSYNVKRSATSGEPYSVVGVSTATNYIDSVSNGQTWYYVVSASNAGGESANSSESSTVLPHILPFHDNFESLSLGALSGQNAWSASDAIVQSALARDSQAGSITSETGYVEQTFAGVETNVWIDFEYQPIFFDNYPTSLNPDATAIFFFNSDGHPVVADGTNFVEILGVAVTNSTWVRVTVKSDYVAKKWDFYVDSTLAATNLDFHKTAATAFNRFRVEGSGGSTVAVDNVHVDRISPFGAPSEYTLTVSSPYGNPIPSGVSLQTTNSLVNAFISNSTLTMGGATQYVCTGWVGTGSLGNGSGTNTSFTITNDSTISWQWTTNYWIELNKSGN